MRVSCPAKVVLLGEYSVLEGGQALVAAVNARAVGTRVRELDLGSPVVAETRARALVQGGRYDGGIGIDTARFRRGKKTKLGIGSSSATALCTAALVRGAVDETTLQIALDGHRAAAQGRGSGIDLRASFTGGVLTCSRQPGPWAQAPAALPGYTLSIWFLGSSSLTSDLIARCKAASEWSRAVADFGALAREGLVAWAEGEAAGFLGAVRRFGDTMGRLGEDAGVDLLTEPGRTLMAAARAAGGAAKPSGAGGGDVAVAWTPEGEDLQVEGVRRLKLRIDPVGLVIEHEARR
ncbi:MAG: hypothetical protein AAGD10_06010 [Myxococcota bacterium]